MLREISYILCWMYYFHSTLLYRCLNMIYDMDSDNHPPSTLELSSPEPREFPSILHVSVQSILPVRNDLQRAQFLLLK